MDQRIFQTGLSFAEYVAKLEPADKAEFERSYGQVKLSEDDKKDLARLHCCFYVLAFSEGWCGDCRINLPVVAKMAAKAAHLELRCFSRDENPELAKQYKIERIPTFILMNERFEEIGRWVERPAAVAEALVKGNEEEKRFVRVAYNQGRYQPDTIDEILDLLLA